jgi:hypothetical protein
MSFSVVLSLAKMELENFFKSVMPVADYFDQSDMLVAVSFLILMHILTHPGFVMRKIYINLIKFTFHSSFY